MEKYNESNTKMLYWDDSYKKEFEAKVVEIIGNGIILNETLFYPVSGGQQTDQGTIILKKDPRIRFQIIRVEKQEEKIVHFVSEKAISNLKKGDIIIGKIDWDRRYELMKAHTSQHVLSAILQRNTNVRTIKAVIDRDDVQIFLEGKISDIELKKALFETNTILCSSREITTTFHDKKKLIEKKAQNEIRGDLDGKNIEQVRVVSIGNSDKSLCGGTHVKNTNEIGIIALMDFKGDLIRYVLGKKALEKMCGNNVELISIAKQLAIQVDDVEEKIGKSIEELHNLRLENDKLSRLVIKPALEELRNKPIVINSVKILNGDFQFAERKFFLKELGDLPENYIGIFILKGPLIIVLSSSKDMPANIIIQEFCKKTGNKGGGTPLIAQSSTTNPINDLATIKSIISGKK